MHHQFLGEEHIAIHGFSCDRGHLCRLKLDEGVVLGLPSLLVAGHAKLGDDAKLREKACGRKTTFLAVALQTG